MKIFKGCLFSFFLSPELKKNTFTVILVTFVNLLLSGDSFLPNLFTHDLMDSFLFVL